MQYRARSLSTTLIVLALFAGPVSGQQPSSSGTAREILGPPRGVALSGDALEAEASHVGSLLRCPVCQGLSIDDSPAPMARNMSLEVRDLLAAGYDQEQVLQYFERSYGEFVLLQPPLRGVNWLVWLAPIIALGIGGFVVVVALRRMSRESAPGDRAPGTQLAGEAGDPELERYLAAARELAADESSHDRTADSPKATS